MKNLSLAAIAALALAGSVPAFGTVPTWTQRSFGFYNPDYAVTIEYYVDAYDSTSSLNSLRTAAYDQIYDDWTYANSTGTGAHRVSTGYGYTYDGYSAGQIWITDFAVNYYYTTQFTF